MINKNIRHWTINESTEGLLFFALRMDEILFDYTLDTFKAPALNTALLCEEFLNVADEIEEQKLDSKNLELIFEELKWLYGNDIVAKAIVGKRSSDYLDGIDLTNHKQASIKINLLYNKLKRRKYLDACQRLLTELVKTPTKKSDIDSVIKFYVSGLIDIGYNQSFIYSITQKVFFTSNLAIDNPSQIDLFFNNLDFKPKKYKVIYKCSSLFKEIKDSCQTFGIEISEQVDCNGVNDTCKHFIQGKKARDLYLTVSERKNLENFSAKERAEDMINKIASLFVFFHHKEKPIWSDEALVYDIENPANSWVIGNTTRGINKVPDMHPQKAAKSLQMVLRKFRLEEDSFSRFDTATDLHAIAVNSKDIQNQLLNLWIAVETLIPPDKSKSKIENYVEVLSAHLVHGYLKKVIDYLARDIVRWSYHDSTNLFKKIPSDAETVDKLAALLSVDSLQPLRDELFSKLSAQPLLKYRIFKTSEHLKSAKSISDFLNTHEFKVRLHLFRIYRTRNLIVHSGTAPNYTEILVENLHNYVDTFLNKILDLVLDGRQIDTIEQGIQEIRLLVNRHKNILKTRKDEVTTHDNYKELIFGQ